MNVGLKMSSEKNGFLRLKTYVTFACTYGKLAKFAKEKVNIIPSQFYKNCCQFWRLVDYIDYISKWWWTPNKGFRWKVTWNNETKKWFLWSSHVSSEGHNEQKENRTNMNTSQTEVAGYKKYSCDVASANDDENQTRLLATTKASAFTFTAQLNLTWVGSDKIHCRNQHINWTIFKVKKHMFVYSDRSFQFNQTWTKLVVTRPTRGEPNAKTWFILLS